MSPTTTILVDSGLLVVGVGFLVTLLAASWTSIREGEPRAAWILAGLALGSAAPFLLLGVADFPAQPLLGGGLLAATALVGLVLFVPTDTPSGVDDTPKARIDERDIMFSRRLLEPGSQRFAEYYGEHPDKKVLDDRFREKPGLLAEGSSAYHPLAFRAASASFDTIAHLKAHVDGPIADGPMPVDAETATLFIERWALKLGAVSVGVTEVEDYHLYSHVGRGPDWGQPVTLAHRYAVALTVQMDHDVLHHAPLAPTVMESAQQYVDSGVIAVQLAEFIRGLGYPARAHIDGNYRVVCPLVARDAGLGEIGRMGLLMTPELGPRVRIAVVTTDLELAPSPRHQDPTVLDFCARCSKCADACPSDAISTGPRETIDGVPRWQIDSEACFTLWCVTGTDCARCMAVCPYSHPANWLHDMVRFGVRHSSRFRTAAIWGDDLLYGRQPPPRPVPEWMGDFAALGDDPGER